MDKTIHNFTLQYAFPLYKTKLTGKPSTSFERALNSGLETSVGFYLVLVPVPCTL